MGIEQIVNIRATFAAASGETAQHFGVVQALKRVALLVRDKSERFDDPTGFEFQTDQRRLVNTIAHFSRVQLLDGRDPIFRVQFKRDAGTAAAVVQAKNHARVFGCTAITGRTDTECAMKAVQSSYFCPLVAYLRVPDQRPVPEYPISVNHVHPKILAAYGCAVRISGTRSVWLAFWADECCILDFMDKLYIGQVEAAINRARQLLPASGHEATLSRDVALLADVYGSMIYARQDVLKLNELDPAHRDALVRWSLTND